MFLSDAVSQITKADFVFPAWVAIVVGIMLIALQFWLRNKMRLKRDEVSLARLRAGSHALSIFGFFGITAGLAWIIFAQFSVSLLSTILTIGLVLALGLGAIIFLVRSRRDEQVVYEAHKFHEEIHKFIEGDDT